jgi:hydroxymethylpyrimidine kinase/phosphomethylpyrimidine kinase
MTIAGSDSSGGAGIQADLKTFTVLGVYGSSVITALTAQNTLGVHGVSLVEPGFVRAQLDAVLSDIPVDAIKTGMLGTAPIVEAVAAGLATHRQIPLVVDPVMIAKGGQPLLDEAGRQAVRQLMLPLAMVVTPNLHEAAELCGRPITDLPGMIDAAKQLCQLGPKWVLVKGGHLDDTATDVLWDGHEAMLLPGERLATRHTHGTGCTLASAIAAFLAHGDPVARAVRRAKVFVTGCIAGAPQFGGGAGPTNHLRWLGKDCPEQP